MFSKTSAMMALAILLASISAAAAQSKKMKIYISVDMEGVAGVVTADQLLPQGFEYERFRQFMTDEVNAAIEGARAAGATEFVISDSHGNAENILVDKLPTDVPIQLVRGFPRPLSMMQGIDDSFAGAMFIGYHASTDSPEGVRAHTMSSAYLTNISLNGAAMPEAGVNAAIAGEFNVPVIMISGDDVINKQAKDLFGDIEGAIVKKAAGFHSAETLLPKAACNLIRARAEAAVKRIADFKPYKLKAPIQLDVSFKNYRPAEVLSYLPIVHRTGSHSIRFMGRDMVEVSKFLEFVTSYEPGLAP